MIRRLATESAALLLLALACAWASNAAAGPARHLSWFPKAVRALPALPPLAPAVGPTKVEATATGPTDPSGKIENRKSKIENSSPQSSTPMPKPDSAPELLARFPPLLDKPQAEVSSAEARWLHDHGALFLDARRTAAHAQGHIAGSKVLSVWEDGLADKVEQLSMFTKDLKLPVVIYCSGGDCHDSHLLAEKLWIAGFRNLRIYTAGYPDWEARRWPIAKSDAP